MITYLLQLVPGIHGPKMDISLFFLPGVRCQQNHNRNDVLGLSEDTVRQVNYLILSTSRFLYCLFDDANLNLRWNPFR